MPHAARCWVLALCSCVGTIEAPAPQPVADPEAPLPPGPEMPVYTLSANAPLPAAIFANAVDDVFGFHGLPADALPTDPAGHDGFESTPPIDAPRLMRLVFAAEDVAAHVLMAPRIASLGRCAPDADERACVRAVFGPDVARLSRFGNEAELETVTDTYLSVRADAGAQVATRVALATALTSPALLYRDDLSGPSTPGPLSGAEVEARLAAFLWRSVPDAEGLARSGELTTAEAVEARARRMISTGQGADPRAVRAVRAFAAQWLSTATIDGALKSAMRFPKYTDDARSSLGAEVELFVADVVFAQDGRFETLFTSPDVLVNGSTAPLYGLDTHGLDGDDFRKRPAPPERAGVLTLAGNLARTGHADDASPTLRGRMVREKFLCQMLGSPPEGVDTTPPAHDPTSTLREQYRAQYSMQPCVSCHRLMDPIGSALLGFDTAGQYAPFEHNLPVDQSGMLYAAGDATGPFTGARGLADKLAHSRTAQGCFVRTMLRFAIGRPLTAEDGPVLTALQDRFQRSNHDIRDLLVGIAASDAFRFRGEVAP